MEKPKEKIDFKNVVHRRIKEKNKTCPETH